MASLIPDDGLNPAEQARIVLAECRDQGMDFEQAWRKMMWSIPRGTGEVAEFWREWRAALRWAKPFYEAGFYRWEPDLAEVFIALQPQTTGKNEE